MVFCAPIAGIIGNIVGMRRVLIFGTLGYAPYSLALYFNSVYGTQWFLLFGATTCGLSVSTQPQVVEYC
jgi:MFS family permease